MKMSGEYLIQAPPGRVWKGLNDPDVLRACIPGCDSLERISDTELTAKAVLKIGPAKMRFGGTVRLSDLDPPHGYRISGEAQGGASGFAKGGATVKLEPSGQGTLLTYESDAQIGGKLAQMGARLIDASSRKMADEFFGRFAEHMTDKPETEALAVSATDASIAPEAPPPPAQTARRTMIIWLVAAGGILLALLAWALYR